MKNSVCRACMVSVSLIVLSQSFGHSSERPVMSEARPIRSAITGRLWNGVGNTYAMGNAYVFALAADRQEILGFNKTFADAGRDTGRFTITDLPADGEVILVGFHPSAGWNMAVQKVKLEGRYQEMRALTTSAMLVEQDPGGRQLGKSSLGLLAILGWVAHNRLATDEQQERETLSERLLNHVEEQHRWAGVMKFLPTAEELEGPSWRLSDTARFDAIRLEIMGKRFTRNPMHYSSEEIAAAGLPAEEGAIAKYGSGGGYMIAVMRFASRDALSGLLANIDPSTPHTVALTSETMLVMIEDQGRRLSSEELANTLNAYIRRLGFARVR